MGAINRPGGLLAFNSNAGRIRAVDDLEGRRQEGRSPMKIKTQVKAGTGPYGTPAGGPWPLGASSVVRVSSIAEARSGSVKLERRQESGRPRIRRGHRQEGKAVRIKTQIRAGHGPYTSPLG